MPEGAFYGQEATMPEGAFYGQEGLPLQDQVLVEHLARSQTRNKHCSTHKLENACWSDPARQVHV
jgi:hypothetical protein